MDTVSQKLVEIGERRSDWEFVIELGRKLGYERIFPISRSEFAEQFPQADGHDLERA